MGGVFDTVSGGLSKFVRAWLLPSATAVGVFSFVVLPALEDLEIVSRLNSLSEVPRGLILAFCSLLLAFLSSYGSTRIYRFFEGYSWPRTLADRAVKRQKQAQADLKAAAARLHEEPADEADTAKEPAWYAELAAERLKRYPRSEGDVMPTRLGNALKAVERYGNDHYGLDSQIFWSELNACAPESTSEGVEDARSAVDFFISFVFFSLAFALLSLIVAVVELHLPSLIAGLTALVLSRWFYLMAVASTSWLASAMQALVNLGRVELAGTYGLDVPPTLAEERKMWEALAGFVYWSDEDWGKVLDDYRSREPRPRGDGRGRSR
jgi:hypothetical protein